MPHFIISSHGQRRNPNFWLPDNCELHFYCFEGQELDNNVAYPLFANLMNQQPHIPPVHIIYGGQYTQDYDIWNGHWDRYNGLDVNGVFRIPLTNPIDPLRYATTLSGIIRQNSATNTQNVFHCLFCRI